MAVSSFVLLFVIGVTADGGHPLLADRDAVTR